MATEKEIKTGIVFNIQRFSLHDGPGIRTTVFLKGCPLRCKWCHNPESLSPKPQLSFIASRCMGCGRCVEVCPQGVHLPGSPKNFSVCVACGACADSCPTAALELLGKPMTVEAVMQEVIQDRPFYGNDGGLTVSGGEPAMQPEFTLSLLRAAREAGIHTAMETAGWIDGKVYEAIIPWLDLVLFDIKQMNPEKHLAYTSRDNQKIHENLIRFCRADCPTRVIVRTPVIPGFTDDPESFSRLAAFLHTLERTPEVHVLPYNPLAGSKHPRLGMNYALEDTKESDGISPDTLCALLKEKGIQAKVIR